MSEDVTKWLEELGLQKYATTFAENDVDFRALHVLNDEDLKELGVSLGHRRILQTAIAALVEPGAKLRTTPSASTPAESAADSSPTAWERHPDERKTATVLFADITDSTALTEYLDAEDTHELLDGARQRMCAAVVTC